MSYNLNYVFPKKAEAIIKASNAFVKKDTKIIYEYDDAYLLPLKDFSNMYGIGGVVDSNGEYVESSKQYGRFCGKYEFTNSDYIDKKVVYCGFFYKAWGHFITEVVSRLWYVLEHDETIDCYVFLDCLGGNSNISGNYLEFFKLLGIEDKILLINKPTQFSKVLIPQEGLSYCKYYTQAFADMFKYINKIGLSKYTGPKYEKVYFSKNMIKGTIQSNLNIKFVDNYFKDNGYAIFYPENLTLIDTIGIMQNCKYFCGLSSSLAHNQLFGHSNQTMISIEKQAFYNPYQIFVANITGCEVVFVDACRHIFTVGSAGPFLYDYTQYFDNFAQDYGLKKGKAMSNHKYKRMFKKYLVFYFNLNNELPPDWMYTKEVVDMSREMYNDTIKNGKIFHMSFYNRCIMKFRKVFFKWFGLY